MTSAIERRLKALEARTGAGHKAIALAFFEGPREDNEVEVAAAAASAEAKGVKLMAVFFV